MDKCNIYKIDKSIKMNHDDFTDGIEDIISREEKPVSPLNVVKLDQVVLILSQHKAMYLFYKFKKFQEIF